MANKSIIFIRWRERADEVSDHVEKSLELRSRRRGTADVLLQSTTHFDSCRSLQRYHVGVF